MNVTIRDHATLLKTRPARVGAYLQAKGWARVAFEPNRYSLWVNPSFGSTELLLPLDSHLGDYPQRMAELLGDLQREEQRSQLEILRDIEVSGCDIFRFRKEPHSGFLGTIPIEDGVKFVGYARDFLLYAASAEYEPSRLTVAGRRSEKDVARFMSQALLGQTEISSFVVTAQVPVPPLLTDDLFPEVVAPSSEPFERRTGIRLMKILDRTREAALEVSQTNDFQPFSDVLNEGATVNLYSALVEAQEIIPGEPLEISSSWAPIRPIVGRSPAGIVTFDPEIMSPIRAAVEILRPRMPREGIRLFGFVEKLHQEAQEVLIGDLAITSLVEGRARKVQMSLQQPDYGTAIRAFGEKRPIEITGDLVKEGNAWVLRNPSNLVLHAIEGDESELGSRG